jgi:hypothetical protein
VASREHLGARLRRLLHLAVVTAAAAVLAIPMLLGPAATPLVRALGGAGEHHCACGMTQGKCGCPECERLEHDRRMTKESLRGHAVLRSTCDDGTGMPAIGAVPLAAVPAVATLPAVPFEVPERLDAEHAAASVERARPPTPPPRSAA